MLVCVYYCAFGTRDRGCSRHPAFPAPSVLKRDNEFGKPRAKPCREIADAHSIPTSSRRTPGPIRRGGSCLKRWLTTLPKQLRPVVIGIVGWVKRSVPTIPDDAVDGWWARRKCAFAHPTKLRRDGGEWRGPSNSIRRRPRVRRRNNLPEQPGEFAPLRRTERVQHGRI